MKLGFLAGCAVSVLLATSAHAATVLMDLGPLGDQFTLTISDSPNGLSDATINVFDITNVTGHVGAASVTGLVATPHQPNLAFDGVVFYDNDYASDPFHLDSAGFLATLSDGSRVEVYHDNTSFFVAIEKNGALVGNPLGVAQNLVTFRDASAAAVPEPASWALMILGFGGAGVVLRSMRRTAYFSA